MIDAPKVHFHVGAARAEPGLLDFVQRRRLFKGRMPDTHLITAAEYKEQLRRIINARNDLEAQTMIHQEQFHAYWNGLMSFECVAGSQHALLGGPNEIVKKDQFLPRAERRIERLAAVFSQAELTIHLTIRNYIDFFSNLADSLPPEVIERFKAGEVTASWSNVASDIARKMRHARLIVWDFDDPEQVTIPFLASILNLAPADFTERKRHSLSNSIRTSNKHLSVLRAVTGWDDALIEALDYKYEDELEKIENLPGVTLVRASSFEGLGLV